MPIAKEFDPEIILVSAGFDAATGHSPQLGGYKVTAACKSTYPFCEPFYSLAHLYLAASFSLLGKRYSPLF